MFADTGARIPTGHLPPMHSSATGLDHRWLERSRTVFANTAVYTRPVLDLLTSPWTCAKMALLLTFNECPDVCLDSDLPSTPQPWKRP